MGGYDDFFRVVESDLIFIIEYWYIERFEEKVIFLGLVFIFIYRESCR